MWRDRASAPLPPGFRYRRSRSRVDLGELCVAGQRKLQPDAAAPHQRRRAGLHHSERHQLDVVAGSKPAPPSVNRTRRDLRTAIDRHPGPAARPGGKKLNHGHGRNGGEQLRRDDLRERLRELGQLVVELLPETSGQERKSLQQTLHVRIEALTSQKRGEARIPARELRAKLSQVAQLFPVVLVEAHRAQFT